MVGQHRVLHGYAPVTVASLLDHTHPQNRGAMPAPTRESSTRSRFLGTQLRERREAMGLTPLELARRIGWSASTVSRVESGERTVLLTGLASYLAVCGVLGAEQAELLELARAREDTWWTSPHDDMGPDELPALRYAAETANEVTCWHPGTLPEWTQAEAYGVWQLRSHHGAGADVAGLWTERLARQDILAWPQPKQITFYLQESTLRAIPAQGNVRDAQLAHLNTLIAQHRLHIRVVPGRLDHGLPAMGRFWLFAFAGFAPVVCAQSDLVSVFGEREQDVAKYESMLHRLDELALSEQDSAQLIEQLGGTGRAAGRPPSRTAS